MNQAGIFIQVICAILAAVILSYLLVNGRKCRSTYSYMLCIGLLLFWNLAEIILLMSNTLEQEMLALKIKFFPVVYIGVSWLYFCLTITNHKITNSRLFKCILLIFPAVCYIFLLTNECHHLFYIDVIFKTKLIRGPVFWIHTIESYFCIILGTVCFLSGLDRVWKSLNKKNLFFLALLSPLTANILMLTGVIPNEGLDITAQVLLVTLIIFGIVVHQKKFLNLIPIAARHFIENMPDGIVIIDHENYVVGMNEPINNMLPGLKLKMYDSVHKLSNYISNNANGNVCDTIVNTLEHSKDIRLIKGNLEINGMNINIEIGMLAGLKQSYAGRIVIVEDRSEEQQLLDQIKDKNLLLTITNERLTLSNKLLTEANHRLGKFSKTAEELAITRERNRLGREVHDTVGNTLTLLIALAENVKSGLYDNQEDLKNILDKSIDISRQALNDIRSCLKGMCAFKKTNLAEWLKDLTNNYLSSGTKVKVSIAENIPNLDTSKAMAIYRICQESVTNAIRHGQAKTIDIIIKGNSNEIRLYIIDDGKGCSEIVKGYGLTGMEERVAKLGGSITFGSDGEKGFNIIANLPV